MARSVIALILCTLFAAPSLTHAQTRDADAWRAFAAQLEPNAFVRIRLTNGRGFQGYVVQVSDDYVRVNPRTRIAVPLREVAYSEIASIERQKEPRWNPASKVLLGVGIGIGVLYMIAIAALAGGYD